MGSINKFGNTSDDKMFDDDNQIVQPLYESQIGLDDLENVEGFKRPGIKNGTYGFKLNEQGIYKRMEIEIPKDMEIFDFAKVKSRTPHYVMYINNKWGLFEKTEWDINIKLKNSTVSFDGNSHQLHRIFNSGKIFGNLVPSKQYDGTAIIVKHSDGMFYIGSNKKKDNKTVLQFIPKFDTDLSLLQDPPNKSVCLISGILLSEHQEITMLEGLKIAIKDLPTPSRFFIIIRKEKSEFKVKSFPTNLNITLDKVNVNLDKIKIHKEAYLINRIAFSRNDISDEQILLL